MFEQIFDESYERIVSSPLKRRSFFEEFYLRFTARSDRIADKFRNTDLELQQRMLKKSFYSLVTFYASGQADDYLEKIALSHSHRQLDIEPELYDIWLETLIKLVADFDEQFDDRVELAWRLVLAPGIVYMKFMYDKEGLGELER